MSKRRRWGSTKGKAFLTKHRFWQPFYEESLVGYNPLGSCDKSIEELYKFCGSDFAKKLKNNYGNTFLGRMDTLITKLRFHNHTKKQEKKVLAQLMMLAEHDIAVVSKALTDIYTIQDKHNGDVAEKFVRKEVKNTSINPLLEEFCNYLPVWIGAINEVAPPLVGANSLKDNCNIEPGRYIAAFVLPENIEDTGTVYLPEVHEEFGIAGSWILARVLKYDKKTSLYQISNVDVVENPHFNVERKALIPLPVYRADPAANPEAIFPKGALVLALFTNTTMFFPAIVLEPPETVSDCYVLRFRDMTHKVGFGPILKVQQKFVVKYKEAISIFTSEQRRLINEDLERMIQKAK